MEDWKAKHFEQAPLNLANGHYREIGRFGAQATVLTVSLTLVQCLADEHCAVCSGISNVCTLRDIFSFDVNFCCASKGFVNSGKEFGASLNSFKGFSNSPKNARENWYASKASKGYNFVSHGKLRACTKQAMWEKTSVSHCLNLQNFKYWISREYNVSVTMIRSLRACFFL